MNLNSVEEIIEDIRAGKAYVKLSAPYLVSSQPPDYPDVVPLAKALVAANPERMLWATNWPHPNSSPGAGRNFAVIRASKPACLPTSP